MPVGVAVAIGMRAGSRAISARRGGPLIVRYFAPCVRRVDSIAIGFPAWTGGVVQLVDQYDGGTAGCVARCRQLAEAYGERFLPSPGLAALVEAGAPFRPATGRESQRRAHPDLRVEDRARPSPFGPAFRERGRGSWSASAAHRRHFGHRSRNRSIRMRGARREAVEGDGRQRDSRSAASIHPASRHRPVIRQRTSTCPSTVSRSK